MVIFLEDNDKVVCSSCHTVQPYIAEYYVENGQIDEELRHKGFCVYCDKLFISERMSDEIIRMAF